MKYQGKLIWGLTDNMNKPSTIQEAIQALESLREGLFIMMKKEEQFSTLEPDQIISIKAQLFLLNLIIKDWTDEVPDMPKADNG